MSLGVHLSPLYYIFDLIDIKKRYAIFLNFLVNMHFVGVVSSYVNKMLNTPIKNCFFSIFDKMS